MTSSSFTHQLPPACRLCLLPEKDHINENRPEVSKMQGQDALQFSVRMVLAQTEAILKSLSSVVPLLNAAAPPSRASSSKN